ncbi:XrtA-associated tyrosine autokinase [Hydrogenophaga sp. BPS33]|uniref:XrtA-associated tyrosine autokinase n=1 Tax=Hydrogenophaga sp. BPS33 TaxID=2651974 RepID=UPI00132039B5|nr:XrtA-associated tyrosine autokinase [Hydrogenophaga sp. BPS33]QHE85911.1 tyrosine-protein kinase family protein [Hydrogenophaga sp. BPS33]
MSSLIEKAAQRLEQLRQAGADVPPAADAPATAAKAAAPAAAPSVPPSEPPKTVSKTVRLDLAALTELGFVTSNAPRAVIADQYRVIKRPLIANATGKGASAVAHGNRIMVTSAMPGEGKSFTAINLAMSIAMELDYTVLLVDADVSRPSIMKTLGLPQGPGLLDLLTNDKIEMSDTLLRTNVDKLSLLPSGTPHPRATELLASDAMTRLIEEMGHRYPDRIIIFDSPPLLLTTESRVLATHMGQIVMVVQAEKTLQSQVKHALTTIESCPIKLMVLNQVHGGDQEAHGYGYGYGHGAPRKSTASDAVAA